MQQHNLNPDRPEHGDALTPAERELERSLAGLSPARHSLRPERVLFEAGRAAGEAATRRRLFAWRAAAAVLLLGLGLSAVMRGDPRVVERERIVYVPATPDAATHPMAADSHATDGPRQEWRAARDRGLLTSYRQPLMPSSDSGYLAVRDAVLRWGVRVMPSPPAGGRVAAAASEEPTLDSLLGPPPRQPAAPRRPDLKALFFGESL